MYTTKMDMLELKAKMLLSPPNSNTFMKMIMELELFKRLIMVTETVKTNKVDLPRDLNYNLKEEFMKSMNLSRKS